MAPSFHGRELFLLSHSQNSRRSNPPTAAPAGVSPTISHHENLWKYYLSKSWQLVCTLCARAANHFGDYSGAKKNNYEGS